MRKTCRERLHGLFECVKHAAKIIMISGEIDDEFYTNK